VDCLSRIPLVTRKKKNSGGGGEKSNVQPLKHFEVSLDGLEVELALRLGDGDLTLGIRRCIVLATMRQFKANFIAHACCYKQKHPQKP
jgi:hypothetical protein